MNSNAKVEARSVLQEVMPQMCLEEHMTLKLPECMFGPIYKYIKGAIYEVRGGDTYSEQSGNICTIFEALA